MVIIIPNNIKPAPINALLERISPINIEKIALNIGSNKNYFSQYSYWSSNCIDCNFIFNCNNCQDCFGCVNLKKKQYCILNKQYTKEEYESLLPKIIEHMKQAGEWGQFLPMKYSSYSYNESVAQDVLPIEKHQIETYESRWLDETAEINVSKDIASMA